MDWPAASWLAWFGAAGPGVAETHCSGSAGLDDLPVLRRDCFGAESDSVVGSTLVFAGWFWMHWAGAWGGWVGATAARAAAGGVGEGGSVQEAGGGGGRRCWAEGGGVAGSAELRAGLEEEAVGNLQKQSQKN